MKKKHRKRVPLVRLEMVREKTVYYGDRDSGKRSITDAKEAAEFAASFYHHDDREKLYVCALNMAMEPDNVSLVAVGGVSACAFPVPEIFKTALLSNCRNILLWHNHPSGSAEPSEEDFACTERMKAAAGIMQMELVDHLIVGEEGRYFSFRDEGVIT